MIRHVVMWTLHDPADAPRFRARLEACRGIVPGIVEFEVGTRSEGLAASVDVVLVSAFVDAAALQAYQQHPAHQAMSAEVAPWRKSRSVLDYEIPDPPPHRPQETP